MELYRQFLMKKKRIFLGFNDIAGQIGDFAREYERAGNKVFTTVQVPNGHYKNRRYSFILENIYPSFLLINKYSFIRKMYTAVIYIPIYHIFMFWVVFRFDIFHFMWYLDKSNRFYLSLIKLLRKKVIVSFVGSDVRWVPLWLKEFDLRKLDHTDNEIAIKNTIEQKISLESRLRNVRVFEKYATIIISHPEQAQLQLRPYYNFYLPLDLKQFNTQRKKNIKPIVALGIRDVNLKGGKIVHNLLKNYLEKENSINFDLVIFENMDHDEVIEILKMTDIFIYSPFIGSAGKFSHEAVACGAIALVSYDNNWFNYPPDAPFVHIQANTLIEKLDYYLRNDKERLELSDKGICWAYKWADIKWIASDILDKVKNQSEPEYYPNFFRESATFDTKWDASNSNQIANKWTKYVSKCDWYKANIEPGERSGLTF